MVGEHAIHNGQVIPIDEAVMPITSAEVQSGFYVYEALRIVEAHPVHLDDHLKRLQRSAELIALVHPFSYEDLASSVQKLIAVDRIAQGSMRIQIYGGPKAHLFITATTILTYPDSYYREGVSVITYSGERLFPSSKTGNLLLNYVAREQAKSVGCFEALLCDAQGSVLEGTRSNFFAIKGNRIFTAPDEKVLLGITRERVLEAARLQGLQIVFEAPRKETLINRFYDELFISATSMAAMPVRTVDGFSYPSDFATTLAIKNQVRAWELKD